jgi:hypothetical protein
MSKIVSSGSKLELVQGTNSRVAGMAKQPSHAPGYVVVVHPETADLVLSFCSKPSRTNTFGAVTDRAESSLAREHLFIRFLGHAIAISEQTAKVLFVYFARAQFTMAFLVLLMLFRVQSVILSLVGFSFLCVRRVVGPLVCSTPLDPVLLPRHIVILLDGQVFCKDPIWA